MPSGVGRNIQYKLVAPETISKWTPCIVERFVAQIHQPRPNAAVITPLNLLGCVSCGVPKFAEENIEEYVRLPIALFGRGQFFILRANGDSMIEANIDHGDLVLIRQQNYADEGQIVVALMDDEATLKRYYPEPENRRVRLHPENKQMDDIFVDNCVIQGVAVNVLKDLE